MLVNDDRSCSDQGRCADSQLLRSKALPLLRVVSGVVGPRTRANTAPGQRACRSVPRPVPVVPLRPTWSWACQAPARRHWRPPGNLPTSQSSPSTTPTTGVGDWYAAGYRRRHPISRISTVGARRWGSLLCRIVIIEGGQPAAVRSSVIPGRISGVRSRSYRSLLYASRLAICRVADIESSVATIRRSRSTATPSFCRRRIADNSSYS